MSCTSISESYVLAISDDFSNQKYVVFKLNIKFVDFVP